MGAYAVLYERHRAAALAAASFGGSGADWVHAPLVQLVQATDRFIGVRRARLVLVDDTGLRAAVAAEDGSDGTAIEMPAIFCRPSMRMTRAPSLSIVMSSSTPKPCSNCPMAWC